MLIVVTALEQVEARMLRRAQSPESVGKTWTEEEEQQLKDEFARSEPIPIIATKHERTIRAIEARLKRLGLLRANQRTTDNSFVSPPSQREKELSAAI
jgi:CO dehydrogenase/acetyl-CoA synthase epsilon subunit